jgi:hypothetical protein
MVSAEMLNCKLYTVNTRQRKKKTNFEEGKDFCWMFFFLNTNRQKEEMKGCPASPEQRRPSASSRTHSDGPVSQTLLTSDFKRRELLRAFGTLDDSTPQ